MKPTTVSEKLMYSTMRLVCGTSCGTGFFFEMQIDKNFFPIIVTNQHVVNYQTKAEVDFCIHIEKDDGVIEKFNIKYDTDWIKHPTQDLCFCFALPIFKYLEQMKIKPFITKIEESLIWEKTKLEDLSAVEDVLMVGYPNGLWNEESNLPLFRRGITANHPAIQFKNNNIKSNNIGVVDIACFPGSSGSPIFIVNEGLVSDKKKKQLTVADRVIFLGILFMGPTINLDKKIEVVSIPTQNLPMPRANLMMNLGYYIWASELLEFRKIVMMVINNQNDANNLIA